MNDEEYPSFSADNDIQEYLMTCMFKEKDEVAFSLLLVYCSTTRTRQRRVIHHPPYYVHDQLEWEVQVKKLQYQKGFVEMSESTVERNQLRKRAVPINKNTGRI